MVKYQILIMYLYRNLETLLVYYKHNVIILLLYCINGSLVLKILLLFILFVMRLAKPINCIS